MGPKTKTKLEAAIAKAEAVKSAIVDMTQAFEAETAPLKKELEASEGVVREYLTEHPDEKLAGAVLRASFVAGKVTYTWDESGLNGLMDGNELTDLERRALARCKTAYDPAKLDKLVERLDPERGKLIAQYCTEAQKAGYTRISYNGK